MKIVCGEKKRPGGKLVKLCVKVEGDRASGVILTGDFFAEPEEGFEELISSLSALGVQLSDLPRAVEEAVRRSGVKIYGIELEDIAEAIARAVEQARAS